MSAPHKEAKAHPLEPVVFKAFAERPHHDGTSLGYYLAGAVVRGASKAYAKVARDALSYMEGQGKLVRDERGWWRLPETAAGGVGG